MGSEFFEQFGSDSLHDLNRDALHDQVKIDFRDWTQDTDEMERVFPSLKQVRTEVLTEEGRIKFIARMTDAYESYLDDKLFDRKD